MKVKSYVVLERAVEEGVARGWARAHKHTETPDEVHIKTEIESAVMAAVCEMFSFSDAEIGAVD